MALAVILYTLFALTSAVGAFWIGDHFASRRVAAVSAVTVLLFFVVLALFLAFLPDWLQTAPPTG